MQRLGKFCTLTVIKKVDFGFYLDAGHLGEVLLPNKVAPENLALGDEVEVFLYLDSEDRLIATTKKPLAQVGQFAYLKVVSIGKFGAFLDWGLDKDLFLPFAEQHKTVEEGRSYLVFIYINKADGRIVASSKIDKFVEPIADNYQEKQGVDLIIAGTTPLGYRAIVDHQYWGVLYKNEVFQKLNFGQSLKGYIKAVRKDGKLDLILTQNVRRSLDINQDKILKMLEKSQGFLALHDKTPPDVIYEKLGMSKGVFKQAIGALFKNRQISIDSDGIRLLN